MSELTYPPQAGDLGILIGNTWIKTENASAEPISSENSNIE